MSDDEIIETTEDGRLRVRLVLDTSPEAPYDEYGSPIIRLTPDYRGWGGWSAEHVSQITNFVPKNIDEIVAAAGKWGAELDVFERYMKIFHGSREVETWDSRGNNGGDYVYVTFDTPDWREHIGFTDEYIAAHPDRFAPKLRAGLFPEPVIVNMDEWRAYCEGSVYGWIVEEQATWHRTDDDNVEVDTRVTWEETDSCWGFYGRKYAEEAAREALAAVATADETPA